MDREAKLRELAELRERLATLEAELAQDAPDGAWPPREFYTAYHALAGFVLGMFGAIASLLFNVVGALLTEREPLLLIKYYLTFPLGEAALHQQGMTAALSLTIGCCLYIATGMVLGMLLYLVLCRWFADSTLLVRFGVVTALSLLLWLVNFYGILSWLQPLLFGGDWIVRLIPWPVAALTHLVFGWTMLALLPFGKYVAYESSSEGA